MIRFLRHYMNRMVIFVGRTGIICCISQHLRQTIWKSCLVTAKRSPVRRLLESVWRRYDTRVCTDVVLSREEPKPSSVWQTLQTYCRAALSKFFLPPSVLHGAEIVPTSIGAEIDLSGGYFCSRMEKKSPEVGAIRSRSFWLTWGRRMKCPNHLGKKRNVQITWGL